jgi:hypothetical protein
VRRFKWCPPVLASHSRRQGVVPASIREIKDSTRRSAEVVVGALRVRVAGTGGIAQDPRRSAASSKGWPEGRYHHQSLGYCALRGASLRQPLCGRADCGNPALTFQGFRRFAKKCSRYQSAFMLTNVEVKLGARKHQPLMVDLRIDGFQSTDSKRIRYSLIPMVSFTWTLNPAIRS